MQSDLDALIDKGDRLSLKIDALKLGYIAKENEKITLADELTKRLEEPTKKTDAYMESLDKLEKATKAFIKCREE